MGLDITAFKKLQLVKHPPLTDDDLDSEDVYLYPISDFVAYTDGLEEGLYRTEEDCYSFRAGSHSSYNHWREQLAKVIFLTPQGIWANPRRDLPFIELINNSDAEGFIGPKTALKLAKDFKNMRVQVEKRARTYWPEEADSFLKLYDQWLKAFEYASDGGVVKLH